MTIEQIFTLENGLEWPVKITEINTGNETSYSINITTPDLNSGSVSDKLLILSTKNVVVDIPMRYDPITDSLRFVLDFTKGPREPAEMLQELESLISEFIVNKKSLEN